jgi:hypothetical protein
MSEAGGGLEVGITGSLEGTDVGLKRVVAAWGVLPEALRDGIVAMVNAACPTVGKP